MKRLTSIILPLLLVSLGFCSCVKVHEFPEQGKEVDPTEIETTIDMKCSIVLEGLEVVTKSALGDLQSGEDASLYDRRFVVKFYENEYSKELVESHTIYKNVEDVSDLIVEAKLHSRKYKVVIWMDYVRKGTGLDLYYHTSNGEDLKAIRQPKAADYVACSDFKDAQTFTSDIDLTPYAGQWNAEITIPAPLERPMAKITILSNDLAEYASKIKYTGSLQDLAKDLTMEISYDGYYPTGFNAHTGNLNDSEPGYGFKSEASYPYVLEDTEYTRVGFDYVFVNGKSSSVTITVRIKTKSGQFINEVNNVVVPITRNKETVLIYKFFTKEYVPGIGIDPGFEGDFDIYV